MKRVDAGPRRPDDLIAQLRAALGEGAVLTGDLEGYTRDWRGLVNFPALCVVRPADTAQLAAIVRICAAAGARIVPQGGNTGLVAGGVPVDGGNQVIVSFARMNRIRRLDVAGNTVTVEAGCVLKTVQDAAAAAGRLFPVSLGSEGSAQIGGLISTNAGGMNVLAYGSMRAQVLGLEVVLADGAVWDGLRGLRKDNTGLDLKHIFIGAEGTLGLITAATLTLHPAVTARATALIGTGSVAEAMRIFAALRDIPGLILCEYVAGAAMALAGAHCAAPVPFAADSYVLAEIAGPAAALETVLAGALENGLATDAVIAQSERERINLLALRDAVPDGELIEGGAVKHDVAVPLAAIADTVAGIEALVAAKYPECRLNIFGHLGDGNLHINVRPPPGQTVADLGARKAAITADVEAVAVAHAGSFSAEHGIGQLRQAGMAAHKSGVELALMRAIKAALDPLSLFNPNKMLPPAC